MTDTKLYVRIEADDRETSTLNAINSVLRASALDTAEQRRVLQYLLDRRQPKAEAAPQQSTVDDLLTKLANSPAMRQ
jgi:hypothetical protein